MNAKEIRQNTLPELNDQLTKLKEELFNLRFQLAINQLDNPMRIAAVRRTSPALRQSFARTSSKTTAPTLERGRKG